MVLRLAAFANPEAPDGPARAMLFVHGLFDNLTDARAAVQSLTQSGDTEQDAFVVDETGRWLCLRDPTCVGVGEEEEEVAATENDDAPGGRMGSVCDVRRSAPPSFSDGADKETGSSSGPKKAPTAPRAVVQQRSRQLDDLLAGPMPALEGPEAYEAARHRHATLRAFERKLRALLDEGTDKTEKATASVAALDRAHPEHGPRFLERYRAALRESGVREERVGFFKYLLPE